MEKKRRRVFHGGRCSSRDCQLTFLLNTCIVNANCLLLQETDKATIDVEAQDDGILAKIIVSLCTVYL